MLVLASSTLVLLSGALTTYLTRGLVDIGVLTKRSLNVMGITGHVIDQDFVVSLAAIFGYDPAKLGDVVRT